MALVFAQPRFFVVFSYWQKFGIKSRFCPKRHFLSRFCQVLRCIFIFLHHPLLILNFSQGNEIYRNKVYLVYKYVCDSLWRWRSWLWGRLFVRIIIENVTNRKQNGRIALHGLCTCHVEYVEEIGFCIWPHCFLISWNVSPQETIFFDVEHEGKIVPGTYIFTISFTNVTGTRDERGADEQTYHLYLYTSGSIRPSRQMDRAVSV